MLNLARIWALVQLISRRSEFARADQTLKNEVFFECLGKGFSNWDFLFSKVGKSRELMTFREVEDFSGLLGTNDMEGEELKLPANSP